MAASAQRRPLRPSPRQRRRLRRGARRGRARAARGAPWRARSGSSSWATCWSCARRPWRGCWSGCGPSSSVSARRLGERRVTLVPGNHDHGLAEPWLARRRLAGEPLGSEQEWRVERGDGAAGVIASWLPRAEVTLAYPGLQLTPEVYATHGHYLDLHLTVPRVESIAASAMGRITGRGDRLRSAADFEAVFAPLYGFYAGLSEGASRAVLERGAGMSRAVWSRATGDGRVRRVLLGRVTIPAAVAALNRLRIGPLSPVLSGEELRRAGLLAMGRVADVLAPVRRARDLRAHPPPGAAAGRRPGRVDHAVGHAPSQQRQLVLRARLRARPRRAQPLLARHAWCTWSRARRRAWRTRCAATPPRRRARARAPQRPACRRPRRTRACACGRAR